MNIRDFEQSVLKLAFETDARITTASVAYYLGIPSREANDLLNALLEEGALELDSDETGNLFYRVPQNAGGQDAGVADLKRQIDEAAGKSERTLPAPTGQPEPLSRPPEASQRSGKRPSVERFLASADEEDAASTPAFSPSRDGAPSPTPQGDSGDGKSGTTLRSRSERRDKDNWGGFDDYYGRPTGHDGSRGGKRDQSPQAVWASVATRVASPDASLDRCGSSSVVVSTDVRCEPRPLPSSRPVIISCSEEEPASAKMVSTQNAEDLGWFDNRSSADTALVPASGEAALSRDYIIDQPEHQPGMALLLSLILPGTGQIYNGEMSKGIMMMVMSFLLWWALLGWVVHIWSIVDAVVVAERLSRKQG